MTNPINKTYSTSPSYKLEKLPKNKGFQFVYQASNSTFFIILTLVLSGIFLSILDDVSPWAILIFAIIIGGIFFVVNSLKNQLYIFDTKNNQYYEQNKKSKEIINRISFEKIKAIQLLHYQHEERISATDEDDCDEYRYVDAYELNLVLENKRFNLFAHSNYKCMKSDANRIARLLNVSVHKDKA